MKNRKNNFAFALLIMTILCVNVEAQMIMSKASTLPTKPVGGNYAPLQKWSNPNTWMGGKVPTSTNQAHIGANSAVLLDMNVDVNEIHVEGILVVDYSKDIKISTELLMAMNNGYFEWGVPNYRYTKNGLLVLKGNDLTKINENIDDYKSLMAESGGEVSIHGEVRKSWTMLNATVLANKNAIVLSEPVDWRVGDEILITSTGMETTLKGKNFDYNETETRIITGISTDKKGITLDKNLTYQHFGKLQTYSNGTRTWVLDERAEVGLLSRNIKIQGDASSITSQLGGHIMAMSTSKVNLSGVELSSMGQLGIRGHYPFHWHVAGDVNGQYIKNSVVKNCFNRAITVHATNNALVQDNVVYNTIGHALFLEDGNETGNTIDRNLVAVVKQPPVGKILLPSDVFLQQNRLQGPSAIWISNPTNTITNNAVCGTGTGYWNAYARTPGGTARSYVDKIPFLPLSNMDNNRAHACYVGMDFDFADDADRTRVISVHYFKTGQKINNFTGFKNYRSIWFRGSNMEFSEFKVGDDEGRGAFISTFDGTFSNGLAVGRSENITGPEVSKFATSLYDGVETIRNCHFVNYDKADQAVFNQFGGANKYLPHYAEGLTFSNCTIYNPDQENEFTPTISFVQDNDGSLTGTKNNWMTTAHPFITDDVNFKPIQAGFKGQSTQLHFGRLQLEWPNGLSEVGGMCYEHSDGHIANVKLRTSTSVEANDIPLVLDGGKRKNTIRFFDKIPLPLNFRWDRVNNGDRANFKLSGMPQELIVSSSVKKVANLTELAASTVSAYAFVGGEMYFNLVAVGTVPNRASMKFSISTATNAPLTAVEGKSRPYKGTLRAVNTTIEAEHFDHGGQNAAYYENVGLVISNATSINSDHWKIRPAEMVDLKAKSATNYVVADFKAGEWIKYSVNIPNNGRYKLEANLSTSAKTVQKLEVYTDNTLLGTFDIAPTTDDNTFSTFNLGSFDLTKGTKVFRFKAVTSNLEMDWFKISSGAILPIVSLTSPLNNAKFTLPATINFAATASDADGSISKVEFFADDVKIGEDLTSPYSLSINTLLADLYKITAKATDNSGNTSVSIAVAITVLLPNKPPIVSITSPVTNATFNVPYNLVIKASATDQDGTISKVEFLNGTTVLGVDIVAPYEFVYTSIPNGIYNLTVRATDDDGAISTSSAVKTTILLVNDCAGVAGGTAALDVCGTCVGGTTGKTTLDTDGDKTPDCKDTDDDNDGVLDNIDCNPINKLIGVATIWYADTDADGKGDPNVNKTACTQPAGFVSTNTDQCPTDPLKIIPGSCGCGQTETSCLNKVPTVSFTSPANQAILATTGGLIISALASDPDGTVANVTLYIDNVLVKQITTAPYNWGTEAILQNISLGLHTLKLIATDNKNAKSETTITIEAKAKDCANVIGGNAYLDECNICIGGTTGKTTLDTDNDKVANCLDDDDDNDGVMDLEDCNPLDLTVLGKTKWYSDIDGDGYGDDYDFVLSCSKPAGYVLDNSDECPKQKDRQNAGDCGCSVPVDACFDCKGAPFGTAFVDNCKLCVSNITEACKTDCFGDWGGTAFLDSCKTCAGGNTGKLPITNTAQCIVTDLEEIQNTSYWKVSPNPTEGQFNFELTELSQIHILNAEGKIIYQNNHTGKFNLGADLGAGLYLVRFIKDDKIETIKLIKR